MPKKKSVPDDVQQEIAKRYARGEPYTKIMAECSTHVKLSTSDIVKVRRKFKLPPRLNGRIKRSRGGGDGGGGGGGAPTSRTSEIDTEVRRCAARLRALKVSVVLIDVATGTYTVSTLTERTAML